MPKEKLFAGTYNQSVDAKGRMTFPAKLRDALGDSFIITKGVDGCLFVYSSEDFAAKAQKLKELPMAKSLPLQRIFFANASEVEPDKQGRVLIPAVLRETAGLDGEAVVIGVADHCEIWQPQRWREQNEKIAQDELMSLLEIF